MSKFSRFATISLYVLAFVCLVYVTILALVSTAYYEMPMNTGTGDSTLFINLLTKPKYIVTTAVMVIPIVAFFLLLKFIEDKLPAKAAVAFIGVEIFLGFVLQLAFLASLGTTDYMYADSLRIDYTAQKLVNGASDTFTSGYGTDNVCYIQVYPHQTGVVLYQALIYVFFGNGNFFAFQVANAVFNCGTMIVLMLIVWELSGKMKTLLVTGTMLFLFTPFFLSCSMVYGNSVGLFFSALAVFLSVIAVRKICNEEKTLQGCALVAVSALSLIVAMFVKATCVLTLLGLMVFLLFKFISHKKIVPIMSTVICFLIAWKMPGLLYQLFANIAGFTLGEGLPKTSWIVIGLSRGVGDVAGWWSNAPFDIKSQSDGSTASQVQVGLNMIYDKIVYWLHNPDDAFTFFTEKLTSEWAAPFFMTDYYTTIGDPGILDSKNAEITLFDNLLYTDGEYNFLFLLYLDSFQNAVMFCACFGLGSFIAQKGMKKNNAALLLTLLFLVYFFVYLLWEAKGIYLFPAFILLMPIAGWGVHSIFSVMSGYFSKGRERTAT